MRIDTGSMNETDETRGLAHFLEHMAFNGSENIPEGEMTKRLERFGLAFGADTNASTSFNETTYQLELPDVIEIDSAAITEARTRVYVDPEIQTSVSVSVMKPYTEKMDSIAVRKDSLIEGLGNSMLNRRLGKMARTEASAFITAGVGRSNFFDVAEISSLTVNAQPEKWDAALAQGEQALRQALEYGFSQAELDEQIANLENSLEVSVQTSPTRRTPLGAFPVL